MAPILVRVVVIAALVTAAAGCRCAAEPAAPARAQAEPRPVTRGLRNRVPGTWRGRPVDQPAPAVELEATDEMLVVRVGSEAASATWEVVREEGEMLWIRTVDADGEARESALSFAGADRFEATLTLADRSGPMRFDRVGAR